MSLSLLPYVLALWTYWVGGDEDGTSGEAVVAARWHEVGFNIISAMLEQVSKFLITSIMTESGPSNRHASGYLWCIPQIFSLYKTRRRSE